MDFSWTKEQSDYREKCREFADREIRTLAAWTGGRLQTGGIIKRFWEVSDERMQVL